jgi:hypothetical protein
MKVFAILVLLAGCSVNRKSDQFACGSNGDCKDNRICDRGFCIEQSCPSPCTSCDNVAMTCEVDCAGRSCGTVHCPSGYTCTINCEGNNACNSVQCGDGTACTVTCDGVMACRRIDCGTKACNITCGATANSCPNIGCSDSCKCDVSCNGANVCGSMSCPDNGTLCTQGGVAGAPCSSSFAPSCSSC